MAVLVLESALEAELIEQRRKSDSHRWDEVWEGVYVMSPLPGVEHQQIVAALVFALRTLLGASDPTIVVPGLNVSDRDADWSANYRCPDVAVYLPGTKALIRDTHAVGGPDFLVEIVSPDDRSRDKLDFYARVGAGEALIVDRNPWALELYRLGGGLAEPERSTLADPRVLTSHALPLTLQLQPGAKRPQIVMADSRQERRWLA